MTQCHVGRQAAHMVVAENVRIGEISRTGCAAADIRHQVVELIVYAGASSRKQHVPVGVCQCLPASHFCRRRSEQVRPVPENQVGVGFQLVHPGCDLLDTCRVALSSQRLHLLVQRTDVGGYRGPVSGKARLARGQGLGDQRAGVAGYSKRGGQDGYRVSQVIPGEVGAALAPLGGAKR